MWVSVLSCAIGPEGAYRPPAYLPREHLLVPCTIQEHKGPASQLSTRESGEQDMAREIGCRKIFEVNTHTE